MSNNLIGSIVVACTVALITYATLDFILNLGRIFANN